MRYHQNLDLANIEQIISLKDIALKLLKDGPHRQEKTPRRVRAVFNGAYVLDTTEASHVWEHPYYPQFYIPISALQHGSLAKDEAVDSDSSAFVSSFTSNRKTTDRLICFEKGPLAGLVRIELSAFGLIRSNSKTFVGILTRSRLVV